MNSRPMADLIAYLSGLTVTQGRLAGQAFKPWWQARFVRAGETKPREFALDVEDTEAEAQLSQGGEPCRTFGRWEQVRECRTPQRGKLVRKLIQIIVSGLLGLSVFSVSASALEPGTNLHCKELEEFVVEMSRGRGVDIFTTREPVLRDYKPEQNYIWCLGMGFAKVGQDQSLKTVILSFGTEVDGTIWLDFWVKQAKPSFKWKYLPISPA